MGIFGSSSHRTHTEYVYVDKNPNPDPSNFEVISEMRVGEYLMAEVRYPDATNFEGRKIMIFHGVDTVKGQKVLDPHFAKDGLSPMIRIRPTMAGWMIGAAIMKLLSSEVI